MDSAELKRAAELINRAVQAFQSVYGLAWNNAPDADPGYYNDFERQIESSKREFDSAIKNLKSIL